VLEAIPTGVVTQIAAANPVLTYAIGIVSGVSVIAAAFRLWANHMRNGPLDKAIATYQKGLEERLKAYESRIDGYEAQLGTIREKFAELEQERNTLYKSLADLMAELTIVKSKMGDVQSENERLRLKSDMQEEELKHRASESLAAKGKIAALERQVRELQQINVDHAAGGADRAEAAADKQDEAANKQGVAADKMQRAADRFDGKTGDDD
jgi:chromosome segregation ATPase